MRSQLFRTAPTLVHGNDQVILVKDVDGADPFRLFVENMDVRAKLRTKYGSKNANLQFEAVDAGAAGNGIEIVIGDVSGATPPKNQAFDVAVVSTTITITLATDSNGQPSLTADQVAAAVNADTSASALVRVTRAPGSDGSALFGLVYDTDPADLAFDHNLAGGFDSTQLGDIDVFVSPTGAPDFSGPWEELSDTTFDNLDVNTVKSIAFADKPVRGLMVTASSGGYDTMVVVSAVVRKKGGV